MSKYHRIISRTLLMSTTGLFMSISPIVVMAADEDAAEDAALEEIVTLGTRRQARSSSDTPAPVDVFSGDQLTSQGGTNLTDMLSTIMPSYNVGTQPNSGTGTSIRSANLRGLSPDHTLILVNGKRRHRAAIVRTASASAGLDAGSQGADITAIPAIALKQVEVLRDGAAAQYGSDAIAGVINFGLRDNTDGGTIEASYGSFYEGDGDTWQIAATYGMPLGENGHLNISAEFGNTEGTSRTTQRGDAQALIDAGNTDVIDPVQIWGSPELSDDFKVFINMAAEAGDNVEFYAFGGYATKRTDGTFFYRNPNNRGGTFHTSGTNNNMDGVDNTGSNVRLIGDLTPADGINCLGGFDFGGTNLRDEVVIGSAEDDAALAAAEADPNCFAFNEMFPGGFTPFFGSNLNDISGSTGLRGELDNGLVYDVSISAGRNEISFDLVDSINASLGPDTPLFFEAGFYVELEKTANIDLSYPVEIDGFASPLNIAGGFEWREEQFQIGVAGAKTFEAGILGNQFLSEGINQGFEARLNGFAPFRPEIAGKFNRNNIAFYLDLEADVTEELVLAGAVRFEDFSDFGSTTNFKVSGLYHISEDFTVRSTFATGFRAPTVGQQNFSAITTTIGAGGTLQSSGTVPPTSGPAVLRGGGQLQPETSDSFTLGFAYENDAFSLTVDYFNIKMSDRITFSKNQSLSPAEAAQLEAEGFSSSGLTSFRFFTNDYSSTTQGIDVVATIPLNFTDTATTNLSFAGNWTDTEVTSFDPTDPDELLGAAQVLQIEDGLPNYRANATLTHVADVWRTLVRVNYYGAFRESIFNSTTRVIEVGSDITLDAEVAFTVQERVELIVGANNIFNTFPEDNPFAVSTGATYALTSPLGFNGGFYYAKMRFDF